MLLNLLGNKLLLGGKPHFGSQNIWILFSP